MLIKDGIIRGLLCDGQVAVSAVCATQTVQTAMQLHGTSPCATAALGRTLCAAMLMGLHQKNDGDSMSVIIKGNGTAGQIIATVSTAGVVKGYIHNPQADAANRADGKLDVAGIVGTGSLTVVRDEGGKEPYIGVCNLVSGEIAADIAEYYAKSEQQPTAVLLGEKIQDGKVKSCGGMLIAPLPDCTEKALGELEEKVRTLPPISELLLKYECLEELLLDNFWDIGVQPLETKPVKYNCDCSRERLLRALLSCGRSELEDICNEGKPVEMQCRFCNKTYTFGVEEIRNILQAQGK